ncbi:MAG: magnesium transporter [Xanthomonadales bacterium]|nr:magnesium transporter [Xanthomonadales bacterium]
MTEEIRWRRLLEQIQAAFKHLGEHPDALQPILQDEQPADVALAMEELEPEQAALVFALLDDERAAQVLGCLGPGCTAEIAARLGSTELRRLVAALPDRDAAATIAEAPAEAAAILIGASRRPSAAARDARRRLAHAPGSAGRLMTSEFVCVAPGQTVAEALDAVRNTDPDADVPNDLYVVSDPDEEGRTGQHLLGVISIRDLVMADPERKVADLMATEIVSVGADADADDAARLLAKHKFRALPVSDGEGRLTGVIPADDLMRAMVDRLARRYARAVGTDADVMEHLSPYGAAKKRVPWLLGTMIIELGAGLVIAHFNDVLTKVILLASFMPVISAIAGNVGLQAAAITVRALDTGHISMRDKSKALLKEAMTSMLMAVICGVVLGAIGAIWSRHLLFGAVIGVALSCSMLTAGLMGTVIPMVSKKLGFDPATTAGPFETAFQDVIGFGVFLGLASLLLPEL